MQGFSAAGWEGGVTEVSGRPEKPVISSERSESRNLAVVVGARDAGTARFLDSAAKAASLEMTIPVRARKTSHTWEGQAMTNAERLLAAFLRVGGAVCSLAIVAVFMPREWMALCHERLGLGALPEAPVVEYLARSTSLFYAIFGIVLWLLARDVRRLGGTIAAVGMGIMACGAILLMIDLRSGLPPWWIVVEGPYVVLIGVVMVALQRRARAAA
jgi:hypothetical protein